METITQREALAEMATGNPFSIKWVTYDKARNTGGDVKESDGCKQSSMDYETAIRRISVPGIAHVVPVNVWFITGFNGKKVVLY